MKSHRTIGGAAFIIVIALVLSAVVFSVSCNEPSEDAANGGYHDQDLPNAGQGGGVPGGVDVCNDGKDNDWDATQDSYGEPAHCTVGLPQLTVLTGSVVQLYAYGIYNLMDADVYTVTVVTGGGSGAATIGVTSARGDVTGPGLNGAPITVTDGLGIAIGQTDLAYNRVILYFMSVNGVFNLTAGETWTINLNRFTNCTAIPDPGCEHPKAVREEGCMNVANERVDTDGDGLEGGNVNVYGIPTATGGDPILFDFSELNCLAGCTAPSATYYPDWDMEAYFPPTIPECNDGLDNDSDGLIDMADGSCSNTCDDNEASPPQCNDGIDNDGDTFVDYSSVAGVGDPQCTSLNDNTE